MKDSCLYLRIAPFSPVIEGSDVALEILNGSIALNTNNKKQATKHFTAAVEKEKKMVYNEPCDWMLNPQQYLRK